MSAPRLALEPLGAVREGDRWQIGWRATNEGEGVVRLVSAVAPHARFRGAETPLERELAPGAGTTFEVAVQAQGRAGDVIEYPFLILMARAGAESWRVLARLSVRLENDGTPRPSVQAVTTQRVGFSGEF